MRAKWVALSAVVLALATIVFPLAVLAGTFQPVSVTDQTPTLPLPNPSPSANEPRYISGFGQDDSFTVFFEDRADANRIWYAQTTTGPTGFPAAATRTNIADTHFVVKPWPITVGSTTYAYRGWGSVDNNRDHKFYVSNDLTDWTLVSTFQVSNDVTWTGSGGCYVLYGWHDVIEINGTYYAFAESACSQTFLVRSDNGDDVWEAFDSVGGVPGYGPLELPAGVSDGWTPRGNFLDLGHDRGFGKLYVDPRDSNFYLAVNTAAKASLSPAEFEAAFINPDNWTWHDGTTGPAANAILSATAEHDLRECWVVPNSSPNEDWVIIYDADFGAADGNKALGWATLSPPYVAPTVVWVDDGFDESGCSTAGHEWQYDCFTTVQNGLDAVAAGGTVNVAAGTYAESVTVNKRLTIDGAGSGNTAADTIIDPPGTSSNGIILTAGGDSEISRLVIQDLRVRDSADCFFIGTSIGHVTLDNVVGTSSADGIGIETSGSSTVLVSDLLISDSSFDHHSGASGMGLRLSKRGSIDGLTVTGSHFDYNNRGWYAQRYPDSDWATRFTNINVSDTSFDGNSEKGWYLEKLDHATFDNITMVGSGTMLKAWACGVDINLKYGAYSSITIRNSTFTNSGTGDAVNGAGIAIKARDDGSYSTVPATLDGVLIENCTFSGNPEAIRLGEPGVGNAGPTGVIVRGNSLTGSTVRELRNESLATTNASANWWGSADPTVVATKRSGSVDYTPWLASGDDTSGDPGFQGDFSVLWVDDDSPQTGTKGRIQEGADLVSGSTVYVADGTYTATSLDSIVISTDGLGLIGASRDGTIIDAGAWGTSSAGWPRGIQVKASNVTIKNLTLQGFTGDGVDTGGYGIVFRDWAHDYPPETLTYYTGGKVENVKLQNNYSAMYALVQSYLTVKDCLIQNNSADGIFIARWSDHATITGNTVLNSGNHGIWVGKDWTGYGSSDNATITNNTVDGTVEGGITFSASSVATIAGNDVSNAKGGGYSNGAISLMGAASNVSISNNAVHNNSSASCPDDYAPCTGNGIGVASGSSNVTVNNNSIHSNSGYGLYNAAAAVVNGSGNWWGTDIPAGVASQVSAKVDYTPWLASGTDGSADPGFQGDFSVLWVDDDSAQTGTAGRIQEAINLVSGSTVNVAAGTYTGPILISKSVTLLGPNAAANPNTGTRLTEAILQGSTTSGLSDKLELDAENVVLKGFTFDNLRIDNYNSQAGSSTPLTGGVVIENNLFANVIGTAIYLRDGRNAPGVYSGAVSILNNRIVAPGSGGSVDYQAGTGILVYGTEGSTISGNVILNPSYNGIQLARNNGGTISGNTATGCLQPALQDAQWSAGTYTISGNTLSTLSTTKAAVRLYGFTNVGYPTFNFSGNTIQDSKYGVQIGHEKAAQGYNDIRDANYSFSGDTFVNIATYRLIIYLSTAATAGELTEMDALFAGAYVPGSKARAITTADPFTYVAQPSVVWADDDYTSESCGGHIWGYDAFTTIQGGVDAVAASGTVNVAAGTYNETITFGATFAKNDLTIIGDAGDRPVVNGGVRFANTGAFSGLTLENLYFKGVAAPATDRIFSNGNSGAILDFSLLNCVLDGEDVAGRIGIAGNLFGGDLTLTGNEFKDILGWAVLDIDASSDYSPWGGNGLPFDVVTFSGNHVHHCDGSVALRGNHTTRTTRVDAFDNLFEFIGGNSGSVGEQWAALEVNNASMLNLYHNTVHDVVLGEYEGQAFQLWAIDSLNVYGNLIQDNYQGVWIYCGSAGGDYGGPYAVPAGSVHDNAFINNDQYGIALQDTCTGGPLLAENNFWGDATGPYDAVGTTNCPPCGTPATDGNADGLGDALSENVDYCPWAEHVPPELGFGTTAVNASVDLQGRDNDFGAVLSTDKGTAYRDAFGPSTTTKWGTASLSSVTNDTYVIRIEMERYLDAYATVTLSGGTRTLSKVRLLGGDATEDDTIDVLDATFIGGRFGTVPVGDDRMADINNDGVVDILDLVLLGGNYGQSSPVAWTP